MGNLRNLFFAVAFMLLGFGVQANTNLYITSGNNTSLNAPQIDGVVHVTQGRNGVFIDILVGGLVELTVRDPNGNVVLQRSVKQQVRRIRVNIKKYESGTYTLYAESGIGVQSVQFAITK